MSPRKPKIGRPPRTDNPKRAVVLLPGDVRDWLARHAARMGVSQGTVISNALLLAFPEITNPKTKGRKS